MSITITLQAASDANMTTGGNTGGTALDDSDFRKVYGLPNEYVGEDLKIHFVKKVRWDQVNSPSSSIRLDYSQNPTAVQGYGIHESASINDTAWSLTGQRRPTTTAFQLRCDSITHDVADMSMVSPMPAFNNQDGTRYDTSTPGQMNNLVIAFGMRTEVIKLAGVLVDEGPITAENPRKQVLMNIARMQYLKTGRGGHNSWGGKNSGPLNPNSYPCLTIYDADIGTYGSFDSIGYQPNGLDLVYRGLIKSFAFRQAGGRPNQWFWTMEFQVLSNEHPQQNFQSQGLLGGTLEINRIRLVEDNSTLSPLDYSTDFPANGLGDPARPEGALIELRSASDLRVQIGDNPPKYQIPEDYQTIMISSSNSTPKIDGRYTIANVGGVDGTANTFTLKSVVADSTVAGNQHVGSSGFNEPDLEGDGESGLRQWTTFTNGTKAFVNFGANGGGNALLITQIMELPDADFALAVGDSAEGNFDDIDM